MVVVCNYVVMNKVMLYFSFFILYVCHVCVCVCDCHRVCPMCYQGVRDPGPAVVYTGLMELGHDPACSLSVLF